MALRHNTIFICLKLASGGYQSQTCKRGKNRCSLRRCDSVLYLSCSCGHRSTRPLWRTRPFQIQHGGSEAHWDRDGRRSPSALLTPERSAEIKDVLPAAFTGHTRNELTRKLHDCIGRNLANHYFSQNMLSLQTVSDTQWMLLTQVTREVEIIPTNVWNGLAVLNWSIKAKFSHREISLLKDLEENRDFIWNIRASALQLLQLKKLICLWNIIFSLCSSFFPRWAL